MSEYIQSGSWRNTSLMQEKKYKCGHCGAHAAPSAGYVASVISNGAAEAYILICPACNKPTYINHHLGHQTPGPILGKDILYVPSTVYELYQEARKCITVGAYTSAVLACRKVLMNVSVQEGASENLKFIQYVDYLETNGFLPPKGRAWVDKIRQKGNEATHEISPISLEDATKLLIFTEMLLRFVYEFAGPPAE